MNIIEKAFSTLIMGYNMAVYNTAVITVTAKNKGNYIKQLV